METMNWKVSFFKLTFKMDSNHFFDVYINKKDSSEFFVEMYASGKPRLCVYAAKLEVPGPDFWYDKVMQNIDEETIKFYDSYVEDWQKERNDKGVLEDTIVFDGDNYCDIHNKNNIRRYTFQGPRFQGKITLIAENGFSNNFNKEIAGAVCRAANKCSS